jgi:hypothetical protein
VRAILLGIVLTASAPGQIDLNKIAQGLGQLGKVTSVTEIAMAADPKDARVRPLETIVLQVKAYGKNTKDEKVRLRRTGAVVKAANAQSGWVSKGFAYQGKDEESFFEEKDSQGWKIFSDVSGRFVLKDAFLYTAPETAGRYKVEADLEGKKAQIEIEVTPSAASARKAETTNFPATSRTDPYRALAEHWAPFFAQETWWQPKADFPTRFDYDGDWRGDNNWDALDTGNSQAFIHYAAVETSTHWFLIYNVFHARDYSDRCVIGTCHENDNEGLILTVRKDGSEFGRLQALESLAHDNIYSAVADNSIRAGEHKVYGTIEFYQQTHPVVFIESGGHGIYPSRCSLARFSLEKMEFLDSTGVTLVYKGTAERPKHASDRLVGYDLLSIQEEWWTKTEEGKWNEHTFDDYFLYQPFGNRPALKARIGGAFYGRKEASNKAKPFWGWHDIDTLKRKVLARGQWGLDPAYGVNRNLRFSDSEPFSLDYIYNPYLGIDQRSGQTATVVAATPTVTAPVVAAAVISTAAASSEAAAGSVEVTAQVDGTVDILVSGNQVRYDVRAGQPVMRESATFTGPMPSAAMSSVTVTKLGGRGNVSLFDQPSPANGFTARIRVEDPRGGADTYRVRLDWKK